jgi:hypothetical protein
MVVETQCSEVASLKPVRNCRFPDIHDLLVLRVRCLGSDYLKGHALWRRRSQMRQNFTLILYLFDLIRSDAPDGTSGIFTNSSG